jgi:predicted CopG family antitoxin
MSNPALLNPADTLSSSTSMHDQVQIALAIADEPLLRSLLVHCTPAIAPYHQIGSITSSIGVPIESKKSVDGVLSFELVRCVLAPPDQIDQSFKTTGPQTDRDRNQKQREYARLTRCESETHILGQTISLAQALTMLSHVGFSSQQVEAILNLPYEAWHKSWWYTLDVEGGFTVPFLRLIRTLRYTDGTFTIQYKDYFGQEKPACFKSQEQKVLVEIKTERQSFSKTLEKINYSRKKLGITRAILICDRLSDLEARGFISQGISLYTASELILPTQANCSLCVNTACLLSGQTSSPVVMCRQFCLEAEVG